ncbi:ankyrin repeat-containing protein [Stylonychia lemnae]|uniref:Ankyrin repeat-containing protein n=1 Tax=Stylonychia lemnae TaxID=5949 RepID=A0A078BBN1_STYLE|nr:ankyrin repeat-containing protein [Stylonychia lemnae]|eukprot:CDW90672.1 ankyrin repeat-containing protein [Stylonychia lemnae]
MNRRGSFSTNLNKTSIQNNLLKEQSSILSDGLPKKSIKRNVVIPPRQTTTPNSEAMSPQRTDSDQLFKFLSKDSRLLQTLGLKRKNIQNRNHSQSPGHLLKMYDIISDEENDMLCNEDESDVERDQYSKNLIRSALGSQYNSSESEEDDKKIKLTKFDSIVNSVISLKLEKQRKTTSVIRAAPHHDKMLEEQDSSFQSENISSNDSSSDSDFQAPESVFVHIENKLGLYKKKVKQQEDKASSKISLAVQNHTFFQHRKFSHLKFSIEESNDGSSENGSMKKKNNKIYLSSDSSSSHSSNMNLNQLVQKHMLTGNMQDELGELDIDQELLGDASQNLFSSPNQHPQFNQEYFGMGQSSIAKALNNSESTLSQDIESFVMRNKSQQFDVQNPRNSLLKIFQNSTSKERNQNQNIQNSRTDNVSIEQFSKNLRQQDKYQANLDPGMSDYLRRFSSGVISSIHSRGSVHIVQQTHVKKQQRKVAEFLKKKKQHRLIKKGEIKRISKQTVQLKREDAFKSIQYNDFIGMESYVKQNLLDLNIFDPHGNSLLSVAVQQGNADICDLLIKNGVYLNTQNVNFLQQSQIYLGRWQYSVALCYWIWILENNLAFN